MTRREFIEAHRPQQSQGTLWTLVWLFLFFGVMITGAVFAK